MNLNEYISILQLTFKSAVIRDKELYKIEIIIGLIKNFYLNIEIESGYKILTKIILHNHIPSSCI